MDYELIAKALLGGALIGAGATWMLASDGKVLGVSGIVGGLLDHKQQDKPWRWSFVLGLFLMGALFLRFSPESIAAGPANSETLILAGLLVGFGTRLGNGCTSGHGVCGISRFSVRSLVATITFMITGVLTAWMLYS